MNLNGLNLVKGGTAVAYDLEKVELDPRVKRTLYELANNQQMMGKKLNECIDTIIGLNEVLSLLVAGLDKIENKMYVKEHQVVED